MMFPQGQGVPQQPAAGRGHLPAISLAGELTRGKARGPDPPEGEERPQRRTVPARMPTAPEESPRRGNHVCDASSGGRHWGEGTQKPAGGRDAQHPPQHGSSIIPHFKSSSVWKPSHSLDTPGACDGMIRRRAQRKENLRRRSSHPPGLCDHALHFSAWRREGCPGQGTRGLVPDASPGGLAPSKGLRPFRHQPPLTLHSGETAEL